MSRTYDKWFRETVTASTFIAVSAALSNQTPDTSLLQEIVRLLKRFTFASDGPKISNPLIVGGPLAEPEPDGPPPDDEEPPTRFDAGPVLTKPEPMEVSIVKLPPVEVDKQPELKIEGMSDIRKVELKTWPEDPLAIHGPKKITELTDPEAIRPLITLGAAVSEEVGFKHASHVKIRNWKEQGGNDNGLKLSPISATTETTVVSLPDITLDPDSGPISVTVDGVVSVDGTVSLSGTPHVIVDNNSLPVTINTSDEITVKGTVKVDPTQPLPVELWWAPTAAWGDQPGSNPTQSRVTDGSKESKVSWVRSSWRQPFPTTLHATPGRTPPQEPKDSDCWLMGLSPGDGTPANANVTRMHEITADIGGLHSNKLNVT